MADDEEEDYGALGGIRSLFGDFPNSFFLNYDDDENNKNDDGRQLASPLPMMMGSDFDEGGFRDGGTGAFASMDALGSQLDRQSSNCDSMGQGVRRSTVPTEDRSAPAAAKALGPPSNPPLQGQYGTPSANIAAVWQYQSGKKKYTVSPEQVDRLIAAEMNSLPAQEREVR